MEFWYFKLGSYQEGKDAVEYGNFKGQALERISMQSRFSFVFLPFPSYKAQSEAAFLREQGIRL